MNYIVWGTEDYLNWLEHCIQTWDLQLKKDMELLEYIQRKFTKVSGLKRLWGKADRIVQPGESSGEILLWLFSI